MMHFNTKQALSTIEIYHIVPKDPFSNIRLQKYYDLTFSSTFERERNGYESI